MAAMGLIRVEPVSTPEADSTASVEAARQVNDAPLLRGLAKYVNDCWQDARTAKEGVLPRLQRAHRARAGEYDPRKLAEIRKFGGSEVYLRVVANKCMILEALLKDVYLGQTDKPWSLKATAKPTFPANVEQEVLAQLAQEVAAVYATMGQMPDQAALRAARADMQAAAEERLRDTARKMAERMEMKMEDQLSEGGFPTAMGEFLADFVTYPTAIFKGPTLRKRPVLSWGAGVDGKTAPVVTDAIRPEFERVDPFRAYPAPGAKSTQDGYFIEHGSLSYDQLYGMIGSPGVNEEAVRAALSEAENGGLSNWMGWKELSDKPDPDGVSEYLKRKTHNIDCVMFYGPVKGRDLIEWGIEDPIDDPDGTQEAAVWLVGQWVIKAHLNYDPLGVRPYFSASYKNIPGQFWGESVPDMLADVNDVMQVGGRSLANNIALASGPMVGINVDRLQPGEDMTTLYPWKQFQLTNSEYGNNADRPLEFFQPQMHAQEILAVLEKFYQFADSFSMIPRSAAGDSPTGGVGRTASGFAIQMDAAGKGLKAGVLNVDAALAGMLSKLYAHNMQFDGDETIKGDAQVVARGATALMQLESLRMRRNEFLQLTNNPTDLAITGLDGRATVLKATADDLELDVTKMFQPPEKLAQMGAPQGSPPVPGQMPPQLPAPSQEALPSGHPTTDMFSPNGQTPSPEPGFARGGLIPIPEMRDTSNDEREFAMNMSPGVDTFDEFKQKKAMDRAKAYNDDVTRFGLNPRSQEAINRRAGIMAEIGGLQAAAPKPPPEPDPQPDQDPGYWQIPGLPPEGRVYGKSQPEPWTPRPKASDPTSLTDLSTSFGEDPLQSGLSI